MAYTTKYRLEFDNVNGVPCKIDIQTDPWAGSITALSLVSASLNWEDGDRNKAAGVKRSNLDFSVWLSNSVSAEIFNSESDTEFKVLFYYNNVLNWSGWLDNKNLSYPLQDYVQIDLTAKDGLHLLEGEKLQDLSGNPIWAVYNLKRIIVFCLNKTKLGINFWTWINIYSTSHLIRGLGGDTLGDNDPLNQTYVQSQSFLNGVRDYDDPFTILNKICVSFGMVLFQARGEWHFVYQEDWIRASGLTGTQWGIADVPGPALQYQFDQQKRINIGLDKQVKFIDENALVTYQRSCKSVRQNFGFDISPAFIRNIDLNDITVTSSGSLFKRGTLDYWTQAVGTPDVYVSLDLQNVEKFRSIVFTMPASNSWRIQSPIAYVNQSDNFTFSFDAFQVSSTQTTYSIRIYDGINYYYLNPSGNWITGTSSWIMYNFNLPGQRNYSFTPNQNIPVTGTIQFRIGFNNGAGATRECSIFNLKFDYDGRVYNTLDAQGQFYKSEQTLVNKSEVVDEIYLSDSPNITYMGTLLTSTVTLLPNWFHLGVSESLRFGQIINRALFKSCYRNFYVIEAAIMNAYDGNYIISPLNTVLPDAFEDREFNVATLKVDLITMKAEGTFVELSNTANTNDFDEVGTESFNYIDTSEVQPFVEPKPVRKPLNPFFGLVGIAVQLIDRKNREKKKDPWA